MSTVKVGQVWQDKDKRRDTKIEIIGVVTEKDGDPEVIGLVVGTEETRSYQEDRLIKRWRLVKDAAPEVETETVTITAQVPDYPVTVLKTKHKTREQWLEAAVKELTKLFIKLDIEVPTVRVSVGWPGGRGKKANVIGQCFATHSTTDKVSQIFVSPVVVDPVAVLIVLSHELIHAIDDNKDGHKKNFIKIAKEFGFIPKWTVATRETITDELATKLTDISEKLGAYPHAAIHPTDRPVVQKTYMLKVVCTEDPDYFVRMTKGKIEDYGTPLCPCHNEPMEVEEK